MRSCRVNWITSQIPRQQTALRCDSERGHKNVTRRSELRPQIAEVTAIGARIPSTSVNTAINSSVPTANVLNRYLTCVHGATALSKSGGTLPLQGDAAQPPRLTPRMAGVATAHSLLLDNTRETSTEKRQKREEKERAPHRKTSPTPLPREQERDARGLEERPGEGWVKRRCGLLALWPSGCGTGSCLLRHGTSR